MRRSICIGLTAAVLLALAPSATGAGDNPCYRYSDQERLLADKINRSRKSNDLRVLKLDPELSRVAAVHSGAMAKKNSLYHQPDQQLRNRVTGWSIIGEAVVAGRTVGVLHRRILKQPEHRFLALHKDFSAFGVGVAKRGAKKYGTVVFEGGGNPGTTLSMPDC